MIYIHQTSCISPQKSFDDIDLDNLVSSENNKLKCIEPAYEDIPKGLLRRMGKAVRIGIGSAMPLINQVNKVDGIIIGTANGGMEDCIKFLNQIIDYEEGMLTPTNFVQSTTNAVASQLGLMTHNKGYNITHVHRGLSFENALIDTMMKLTEIPDGQYLLGGVEEISDYNYNIEYLGGWYKNEPIDNTKLYHSETDGSIAGEIAAMFIVNNSQANSVAKVKTIKTIHTSDKNELKNVFDQLLEENSIKTTDIDLFFSGENGDIRLNKYYHHLESQLEDNIVVGRFKHMSGEYPTAVAFAIWLVCHILKTQSTPQHVIKKGSLNKSIERILIYNNYKGEQHSFILMEAPN